MERNAYQGIIRGMKVVVIANPKGAPVNLLYLPILRGISRVVATK
jgi:hypothetical protein